ncbi:MAG: class A beta-lactamase-related serine hydrolase [Spirochaetia bacterium]|nr:class A beta-lactamase-related serine hydrolase [Spirochaetia bacterium]
MLASKPGEQNRRRTVMRIRSSRNFTLLIVCTLTLVFCACATRTTTKGELQASLQEMIENHFQPFKEEYNLPDQVGLLLYVKTPSGAYTVQSGFGGYTYTEDTHYRIASVTKTFTAAAIMLLDQEGKLNIEDSVCDPIPGTDTPYLPDDESYAIPYKEHITIEHLLSHRGGVFDVFNEMIPSTSTEPYAGNNYISYIQETEGENPHQYTQEELASVIAKDHLTYGQPGSIYHYSDSGYMLLATIIERVSGLSYSQFIHDQFFVPLHMTATFSVEDADDVTLPDPFFPGYSRWDAEYFDTTEDNMSSNIGAGNIIATPKEMARWIHALLTDESILSPQQRERMKQIPQGNNAYALGLSKIDGWIGHTGAHPGYMNFVQYHEESNISLVLVAPFIDYNEGDMEHVAAASAVLLAIMEDARDLLSQD